MPTHEDHDPRGEGKDLIHGSGDNYDSPMDRFKSLTKKIIRVNRDQVNEQQRLFNEKRRSAKMAVIDK
jgi:hypothetical protein